MSVLAPPAGEALLLVDALRRSGARVVERDGERVAGIFPPPASVDALVAGVRAAVRASTSVTEPDPTWRWLGPEEWAARWREDVRPRRVSERITVVPAPTAPAAISTGGAQPAAEPRGETGVTIRLDPTAAFGTAEHPTTRACLRWLDARVRRGDRVLDVGTGSGILAVAAVLLGAARAIAVEADPLACADARRNAAANGVADRVDVRRLTVTPDHLRRLDRHDLVLANLEGPILLPLIPALPAALARGGRLLLSGLIRQERDAALAAAGAAGLALETEVAERGWWTAGFARTADPGTREGGRGPGAA